MIDESSRNNQGSERTRIMEKRKEKNPMGWEIAHELEKEKKTMLERLIPGEKHLKAAFWGVFVFSLVFLLGIWLSSNPFSATVRINSSWVEAHNLTGNNWTIIWSVVFIAMFFEFMDASAGMGFGTALTPILIVMGFDLMQIVPVIMIQQGVAGIVGAFLHKEFGNVEWKMKPMSETLRLGLIVAFFGCLTVVVSIFGFYKLLDIDKSWIKLYVAFLLLAMGFVSLFNRKRKRIYKPNKMIGFAALAGFNKGIGGGGYGPVITIGGIISGVPIKSMLAVTALAEGTVSTFSVLIWTVLLTSGVQIDYLLLPSVMIATIVSAVAAPYITRVFPEKFWKYFVPVYCVIISCICFWKVIPSIINL
jgi:uncharacterized membrane protein YfcA